MIRLYGHSAGSFRTVTEGMRLALEAHGKLSGFVPGEEILEENYPGVDAPVSLVVGDPNRSLIPHLRGKHQSFWLMLAPNSNGIPEALVKLLSGDTYSASIGDIRPVLDGLLAPSEFAKGLLEKIFPGKPVLLWQHGVLPGFKVSPKRKELRVDAECFRLLHVTSTKLSRKGTRELLVAWKEFLKEQKNAYLDMLVNPAFSVSMTEMVQDLEVPHVCVVPGQNYSQSRWQEGMSMYHGIVQPSRAEGFGLVPLEALACGVPSLLTAGTGHLDYIESRGLIRIPVGEDTRSDDYWGATAPEVSADDVLTGLKMFHNDWEKLSASAIENATKIQTDWSWENRAKDALRRIEECQCTKI